MSEKRHWVQKVKRSFDECIPLRLTPGEAAQLWRVLVSQEITKPKVADDVSAQCMVPLGRKELTP